MAPTYCIFAMTNFNHESAALLRWLGYAAQAMA
jgi:hypothetical protein